MSAVSCLSKEARQIGKEVMRHGKMRVYVLFKISDEFFGGGGVFVEAFIYFRLLGRIGKMKVT